MRDVYIISAVRTPLGSFGGVFSSLTAIDLGATAIKGALDKAGVSAENVDEVFMGNVVSANLGQAPARQAALKSGISENTPCTTINKVCASGIKSVMLGAQTIAVGHGDIIIAGGMESMSNIPYYVPKARWGHKFGDGKLIDGLSKDGLTDAYEKVPMGIAADNTATELGISREEQDRFSIQSYKRSAAATTNGYFKEEIVPVAVPQRRGDDLIITEDEEFKKVKFEKIPGLRPVFSKDGTVTAANASTINDGGSALVLASEDAVKKYGLKPMAKIVSYADGAQDPMWFTTAPKLAAEKALKRANLTIDDMSFFEVNEAFAVVTMAFNKQMGISEDVTNIFGGAVSLGHPLGCSGARILSTLNNVLQTKDGKYGMAAICNGGGGASAMIIEKI